MKVTRINIDGSMNDIQLGSKKIIVRALKNVASSKGQSELKVLYKWKINTDIELLCYGWYDGTPGFENKHDLPPNGISDFLDDEDDSGEKLLFGDIFIMLFNTTDGSYLDCSVSDYANYYNQLFEGFDSCDNTSEEDELSEDESINTDDEDFINDETESEEEINDVYDDNNELDIDGNDYSETDSDYDDKCEGEDD
tara:strand:+ start:115 stop:702 length:588 start_codon:yes stop_codon:yes gene_type:complete